MSEIVGVVEGGIEYGVDLKRGQKTGLFLDQRENRQRVREHQAGGRTSGVHGTPAFFVDGKLFDVSFGMRALAERVSALLGN